MGGANKKPTACGGEQECPADQHECGISQFPVGHDPADQRLGQGPPGPAALPPYDPPADSISTINKTIVGQPPMTSLT